MELAANSQTLELEQPRSGPPSDPQSAMPVRASITVPGRTSGSQMSVANFEEETVSRSYRRVLEKVSPACRIGALVFVERVRGSHSGGP